MHAALAVLVLLAGPPATPTMSGPEQVDVGRSCWFDVEGVSVAELQAGAINVFPADDSAQIRVLQDLRGTILIWAEFSKAGRYDVQVVAPWLDGREAKLKQLLWSVQVGQAPQPPPEPPGPPGPPQPPSPTTGPVTGILIREAVAVTADQAEVILRLRTWIDANPPQRLLVFPPDARLPDGSVDETVAKWVGLIPKDAEIPYLFLTQRRTSDGKAGVIWQGPLPDDAQTAIAAIEEATK